MRSAALLVLACSSLWAAERWKVQYFYDQNKEELHFSALAFCSAGRGVATGVLVQDGKPKAVAVVTSNGGDTWTLTETKEAGHALFFLDETSGWMVTSSGIWFTDECGRTWRRIYKERGLTDIRFVSPERGWAIGTNKTVIETKDGGKTWEKVKAVEELDSDPDRTTFSAIEFASPKVGIMAARSNRRRDSRIPLWLDPRPDARREKPSLSILMETRDGGDTWQTSKISMFGRISQISLDATARGLGLIEFDDYFDFPSELFKLGGKAEEAGRVFRRKDFAITDVIAGAPAYAAGFEPPGAIFRSPIPGRVRIARSTNLTDWTETEVDYRAVATRVFLARAGAQFWAATDTGMILKLVH
jgi:photosynthesis system II assembly factor YCF48-like protein